MSQDNSDFIGQLEQMAVQMEHEFHGMGRAVNKTEDWMQRANVVRQCITAVSEARNELFGMMAELAGPPQLPNYNQFPERNQEIEFDTFEVPKLWKRRDVEFDPEADVEVSGKLAQVVDVLIKAKREQAA